MQVASFRRSSPFGVITTSGRAAGVERLAAEQVEVLRRGRGVGDRGCSPARRAGGSARGGRSSARGRCPRSRAGGAASGVRSAPHFERPATMNWSMIDLRAVDEVAELRLPEHERLGRGDGVAVLEAERRVLGERRVVHLERRRRARRGAGSACSARRSRVVQDEVAVRERAALGVLAGQPDRDPLDEQASRTRAPRRGPSRCRPRRARRGRRSSCFASFGWTVKPSGHARAAPVQLAQPVGRRRPSTTPPSSPRGIRSSRRLRRDRLAERRLQRARAPRAARASTRAASSLGLLLRDDALVDELRRVQLAHGRVLRDPLAISGCVYAGSSCSLWPKRR